MITPHRHEWDFSKVPKKELRSCRVYEYLREAERARWEGKEGAGELIFTKVARKAYLTYREWKGVYYFSEDEFEHLYTDGARELPPPEPWQSPPPWQSLSETQKQSLIYHIKIIHGISPAPAIQLPIRKEVRALLLEPPASISDRVAHDFSPCLPKVQAGRMLFALDVDLSKSSKEIAAAFKKLLDVEIKKEGRKVADARGRKDTHALSQLEALGFLRLRHALPRQELHVVLKKHFRIKLDERKSDKMASLAKRTFEELCGITSDFMECAVTHLQRTNLPPVK